MGKKIIIIVLCIVLLVLAVFYGFNYFSKDRVTDKQRKDVEATCLSMITLWETDVQTYKDTGDEEAKTSANKAAEEYNRYLQTNSYVFGETLPEGIYAVIEPIE